MVLGDKVSGPPVRVGVVAPCSAVPQVELSAGLQRLRDAGFDVRAHEQCSSRHFTFAGTDEQRCAAFIDCAWSGDVDILWCARGGYGATRLLPMFDEITRQRGRPPRKLLVGYSDVTVLHEYVRTRWNWPTLHAPMPAAADFDQLDTAHWDAVLRCVRRQPVDSALWGRLHFRGTPPAEEIEGPVVGGTLTLWACLMGTPWQPDARGRILFFEDVGEAWYRIDRMVTQIRQSGALEGVRAILLGDFKDCRDETHRVRRDSISQEKVPLRRFYTEAEAIEEIFGNLGLPIAAGLPVGHGPNFAPLPLGARYRLSPDGTLSLLHWDWLDSSSPGAVTG